MSQVLPNWLAQRTATKPAHPALIWHGQAMSYAELGARAAWTSARFHALGVQRGDRVAVLLGNHPDFVVILHALSRLRAVIIPLNRRLVAPELGLQVAASRPRLLVYDAGSAAIVQDLHRECTLTGVSVNTDPLPGDVALEAVAAGGQPDATDIDLDAVQSIIFTSGSSGRPKGVLLTYGNVFWSAVGSAFNLGVHGDDRWLACLPFCHVGGLSILWRSVIYGTTVVLQDGFDPVAMDRALDSDRVTMVSLVANMLQRLLEQHGDRATPRWLRCVLLGGGPAPLALLEACRGRGIPVVQTYGLTEAASQVTTLAPVDAERKLGSSGKPLLGTEIRIAGADGRDSGGMTGEILVRGPTVSPGYLDRSVAAREGGWLRTADLGRFDDEGFLYVVGRVDDMIISGGENVHPAEVEAVLQAYPAVAEACVFGLPDPVWGEVVAASVRVQPGMTVTPSALVEYTRHHLARFKVPRRVHIVTDFPRTASGKIIRSQVRATARAGAGEDESLL